LVFEWDLCFPVLKKEEQKRNEKPRNNHNVDEGRCSLLYAWSKRFFNGTLWPDGDDGDGIDDTFDWLDIGEYNRGFGISYIFGRCI
jgi:hypothetical protein